MKFGKQIQKRQLEIPEYAAHFVDYKALKKLIKELKNSPATKPESQYGPDSKLDDRQIALQANKAPFFFRLDRELDKVNAFYTVKEAESKVRLRVLTDKQRSLRLRIPVISKSSVHFITLEQGFQDFIKDLDKLQQFIEINATAFSKILKKWDKTSKSQTKELYLSRAIEIQPCFNRDVISELSDRATSSFLDCAAWTEGDGTQYGGSVQDQSLPTPRLAQVETDSDLLDSIYRGDLVSLQDLLSHFDTSANARERLTRAFLSAVSNAPEQSLNLLLNTGLADLRAQDEINGRNCLHKAAMAGRKEFVRIGLNANVDATQADAYGRIPLHYACMNGQVGLIQDLLQTLPETVEHKDLDNFTPLIHSIVNGHLQCVEMILAFSAGVDAAAETEHIPLNLACQHGSVPIVELLLRGKPHVLPDAEGLYPQHLVAKFGRDAKLLMILRDYGASLDQTDKLYQWTPLLHAASEGKVECLKTLLNCGANPRAVDEKGLSALYHATWEGHLDCMALLSSVADTPTVQKSSPLAAVPWKKKGMSGSPSIGANVESIPDLSLPPPIIPTRRYGHNFLDTKSTVLIMFGENEKQAVTFYDESKYPAARLTVAPRSSDIIPRNLLLPIQDENRCISFEMDSLDNFALDFDVYSTFGKKVVAKGSVPSEIFHTRLKSSGYHHLALFDPRLRPVGEMSFKFQVIRPFSGVGLDITPFATYWKATSQFESKPSSLVTGTSLSGSYLRVYVQLSRDAVPIVYPDWLFDHHGLNIPVIGLTYQEFTRLRGSSPDTATETLAPEFQEQKLESMHKTLASSHMSLYDVLGSLPSHVHVEIHVLYPSEDEEEMLRLGPTPNINDFVDSLLTEVFKHARDCRRESGGKFMRSIVFTSFNGDLCTALNWKQPNYPVLLCNDLGAETESEATESESLTSPPYRFRPSGTVKSIKEAVRIAQSNNFFGLMCHSRLLSMVPALIDAIKVAGLVLVSDDSGSVRTAAYNTEGRSKPKNTSDALMTSDDTGLGISPVPNGIDGVLGDEGVLKFCQSIDA